MAVKERKCCSVAGSIIFFQRLRENYSQNINEFIRNSSINGLKYFNRRDLTNSERIYFMVTFIAAVASSIYFVGLVVQKWSYSPTIISIEPTPSYITDDPFPAVTICNMNQALKNRVSTLPTFSKEFKMLRARCERKWISLMADATIDWKTIGDFFFNISQSCERMLLQCTFGGYKYNCSQIFRQVIIDEGLCCTFNGLDPSFKFVSGSTTYEFIKTYPPEYKPIDWSVEQGYQQPLPKYYYPMKTVGTGQSLGLNVILNVESDEYYCSSANSIGFKVAVHNAQEEPNVEETGLLLSPGLESFVRIMPRKVISEDKLRHLDVNKRNCIFENEYNLTLFSHYSTGNCLYECKVESMRFRCGCETTFLNLNNSKLAMCTNKSGECLQMKQTNATNGTICEKKCWPNCVWKRYTTSTSSAKLENIDIAIKNPILGNMSVAYVQKNIAIVKFYFKQGVYVCRKQTPYIGLIDVLSSIGGLISVFFGFSFISLVEFIYYICIVPLRSTISKQASEKKVYLRKPCLRLANRPKTRFVNPYTDPSCKLYPQKSYALPQNVWYINTNVVNIPNENGEQMH